ncbi:zinc-binding dehydrogenase [Streptomyces sp. MMG1121]|uniref:zinc-binding dehydrogenase n=1 Tax=Streptomyces sp. MMG1121 TaxID=1415544 RepID=UPI0006AF466F|nr:zinc-binding dehydrogenase [Streptomyces sp. MMG1121]KOV56874.1 zinc-binding dehydrogenase [Streptomyces sp. MMG1121]
MPTMRAARFDAATRDLAVHDVPVPQPGPGEALVRVAACGICHSDLSLLRGVVPSSLPVITPGHEAAGSIAALGSPDSGWQVGDRVVLASGRACGRCATCRAGGAWDDCRDQQVMAFDYDGAWAEYVVVPTVALTRLPEGIPMERAAILADAVATPYAAVVETARLRPAMAVGVWGLGGVGVHLVQAARLVGAAPIVALDPLEAARQRARDLGADHVLDPADGDVVAKIGEFTQGNGLDVAFDVVARGSTMAQASAALGYRGQLVLVGISADTVELGPETDYALKRRTVTGHFGYRKRHIEELVTLVARGRLDLSRSVSAVLPLEDIGEGVRRLAEKEGNPVRIVIRP